MEKKSQ